MSEKGSPALAKEQALLRVATLVAKGAPPENIFAALCEEVGRLLPLDLIGLGRYETDGTVISIASGGTATTGVPAARLGIVGEKNVSRIVFETGRSARACSDADASDKIAIAGGERPSRSAIGAPVTVEGQLWGVVMGLSWSQAEPPTDSEECLANFTDLLATAIGNAQTRVELTRLVEEQAGLRRVATLVAQGLPPEDVFAAVLEEVGRLLPVASAGMARYESDGSVTSVAVWGSTGDHVPTGRRWTPDGNNLVSIVCETERPARIDVYADAANPADAASQEAPVRSAVAAPIVVEGRLWGVLSVGSRPEQPMPLGTEARLANLTELIAMAIANAHSRSALRPVERMRLLAERITERQLSARLPVSDAADEVAALGRTLNAMLDRIEGAVSREQRVVSDASHELRTPLTTLRAEIDLALIGDRDKTELRAALQSASEEAKRMSRLADDLLVLARADQGGLPLHPKDLAARSLLSDAARRARAQSELKGRSIVLGVTPEACRVWADPDRIAQALDNLITNALLYGDGDITLSARSDGEQIELHVADEGQGFPDDLLPRAFERFGRGPSARTDEPGTGLGLAIVQALAVAHGGTAEARNRPDGGADISIALPRTQAQRPTRDHLRLHPEPTSKLSGEIESGSSLWTR